MNPTRPVGYGQRTGGPRQGRWADALARSGGTGAEGRHLPGDTPADSRIRHGAGQAYGLFVPARAKTIAFRRTGTEDEVSFFRLSGSMYL
jgi:hypothetical protein